jgi:hypothetical protein
MQSDVYALAIVIAEIATEKSRVYDPEPGLRKLVPANASRALGALLPRMWAVNPYDRPSVSECLRLLDDEVLVGANRTSVENGKKLACRDCLKQDSRMSALEAEVARLQQQVVAVEAKCTDLNAKLQVFVLEAAGAVNGRLIQQHIQPLRSWILGMLHTPALLASGKKNWTYGQENAIVGQANTVMVVKTVPGVVCGFYLVPAWPSS